MGLETFGRSLVWLSLDLVDLHPVAFRKDFRHLGLLLFSRLALTAQGAFFSGSLQLLLAGRSVSYGITHLKTF